MEEKDSRRVDENRIENRKPPQYRWMLEAAWDGAEYAGWQRQPNMMTVQQCIEEAVQKILGGESVSVMAAGRTDAGVHSLHQILSFACVTERSEFTLYRGLNGILPKSIAIKRVCSVPLNFRARGASSYKIYEYHFLPNCTKDPFLYPYCWMLKQSLDFVEMNQASKFFIGTHDVSAFRSKGCGATNTVRTILSSEVFERDRRVVFSISGKGFLRHQVRIMAGTLFLVGCKKISIHRVKEILEQGERPLAGPTAPSKGLWLCQTFLHEHWKRNIDDHLHQMTNKKI
jgi:tRNA pseudouridine38-40 synthase